MRLNLFRKPIVAFEVSDPKHRKDYAIFLMTGSWRHCLVQYELSGAGGEYQSVIQRKLLEYYMMHEFRNMVDRTAKTAV